MSVFYRCLRACLRCAAKFPAFLTDTLPSFHDASLFFCDRSLRLVCLQKPMGQCLIGIQIFPAAKAEVQPAGIGRTEPNNSPFLPPPNGRLKFGWNPISMLSQLLGPRLCCILCCAVCIALVVVSLIFLQPIWNLIIALSVE